MTKNINYLIQKFNQFNHAVYFSTPDKHHQLFGFGKKSNIKSSYIEEIKKWQVTQGIPVFGGLPFDEQSISSEIMNGYFIAPKYVFDFATQQEWGTPIKTAHLTIKNKVTKIISNINDDNWIARATLPLKEMKHDVRKQKVVLGMQRTLELQSPLDASTIIKSLIHDQPHTYHFVIKNHDELFVSASPERLIKLSNQKIETAAVAGTINRDSNQIIDKRLANKLQRDPKNLHEHELVVHEITDKIAHLAKLKYPIHPQILKTPQVQHLYTPISGTLSKSASILNLVDALHPTPALGGIPLNWALNKIKQTELHPRGLFAAPIGYIMPNEDGEFIIGIRSLWEKGNAVHLFAGAGILAASNLSQESHEINLKMSVMKNIIKEQINE